MDTLSAALTSVNMTGAVFYNAAYTAPWGATIPAMADLAPMLSPETEQLVGYHLVAEGRATVRTEGLPDLRVEAGDIIIDGAPSKLVDASVLIRRSLEGKASEMPLADGGEVTRLVCGYFGCERYAARLFLAGLPKMIKINIRSDAAGGWLEMSIRHLLSEAESSRPGKSVLLSKMAEALFVETLRRYMELMPPEQLGWLAAARDPVVGNALALIHRRPCHPWRLAELAGEAGASRSTLAERFETFLGESALAYLARWRMQLAARKLQASRDTVLQVAMDVGYESESAFNRAFKREFGLPPARYRKRYPERGASHEKL
jgi:AraC-like DNA-binding protein